MSKAQSLEISLRQTKKRSELNDLRRNGQIPGIMYGRSSEPKMIQISERLFERKILRADTEFSLVNLNLVGTNGKASKKSADESQAKDEKSNDKNASGDLALLQDMQIDPLTDKVIHLDFRVVREDQVITTSVPLILTGESIGVKNGGVLEHQLHSLEVQCQVKDLPEHLEADVSEMAIGDTLHVGEIKVPENVKLMANKDVVVAIVMESRALVASTSGAKSEDGAPAEETETDEEEENSEEDKGE